MTEPEECPSDRHDYVGYARKNNACRCPRGRESKNAYMRERRAKARAEIPPHGDHVVDGIKHGSYGFEERGCRCEICREARRTADRRYRERKKAKR